jgi:hypothetical protein
MMKAEGRREGVEAMDDYRGDGVWVVRTDKLAWTHCNAYANPTMRPVSSSVRSETVSRAVPLPLNGVDWVVETGDLVSNGSSITTSVSSATSLPRSTPEVSLLVVLAARVLPE